ncbi:hypothetical protein LFLEISCH_06808 [Listeria fleischmannii subsp. fleischmannii LU2006-1]|nr:hypothetical protein LFLEISCH_06808 [Listeria fleischmannii subsp. fleischmannii LU2006-1]
MVKRFFSYYKPYKKLFALDFGCAVIAALLELAFPLAVNYVIDKLLPGKDFSMIITASLALLFFYFFKYIYAIYCHVFWPHAWSKY